LALVTASTAAAAFIKRSANLRSAGNVEPRIQARHFTLLIADTIEKSHTVA
jgi:hypothetical protein